MKEAIREWRRSSIYLRWKTSQPPVHSMESMDTEVPSHGLVAARAHTSRTFLIGAASQSGSR